MLMVSKVQAAPLFRIISQTSPARLTLPLYLPPLRQAHKGWLPVFTSAEMVPLMTKRYRSQSIHFQEVCSLLVMTKPKVFVSITSIRLPFQISEDRLQLRVQTGSPVSREGRLPQAPSLFLHHRQAAISTSRQRTMAITPRLGGHLTPLRRVSFCGHPSMTPGMSQSSTGLLAIFRQPAMC